METRSRGPRKVKMWSISSEGRARRKDLDVGISMVYMISCGTSEGLSGTYCRGQRLK